MKKIACFILTLTLMLSAVSAHAAVYTDRDTVKKVQQALNDAGYNCGTPDGVAGNNTKNAILAFQAANGLEQTGVIDDELLTALFMLEQESSNSDGSDAPDASMPMGGTVMGDFDEPAFLHPEERYETFFESTDGSEYTMFVMLDSMNDEAEDIAEHGALYITENQMLNEEGKPALQLVMALQNCPYGTVMINEYDFLGKKYTSYSIDVYSFFTDGEDVERMAGFDIDTINYYFESYHFPYGRLQMMNGVRQDDNGYTYFFIKSEEFRSFEFVVGENMRILQLRVYEKDKDGVLALSSYVDYDVGPAWEIPQEVLDAMGEVLQPVDPQ